MIPTPPDPDARPDRGDAGRTLAVRLALLAAIACLVGGLLADDVATALAVASVVAGCVGLTSLSMVQLQPGRPVRQWVLAVAVLLVCGGLMGALVVETLG